MADIYGDVPLISLEPDVELRFVINVPGAICV